MSWYYYWCEKCHVGVSSGHIRSKCEKCGEPVQSSPMDDFPESKAEPDNSHYTKGGIEPWTYIQANDLNFFEGSVVKYVTRWRHKNGVEDLRKARVYIDELIRQEESK